MLGLKWEGETPDEDFGVWPENWKTVLVFLAMGTQWRMTIGPAGPYYQGLDYTALPVVERRCGVTGAARAEVFDGLLVMELEARRQMNARD